MRQANVSTPIQGFTPTRITTTTVLDTALITAIRVSAAVSYHINDDSANTATMPAGVTVIDESVSELTFAAPTTVEVM